MPVKKKFPAKRKNSSLFGKSGKHVSLYAHYVLPASGHLAKPPVTWDPSPNHASRQGEKIQRLVLHNTDGPLAGSLARLKDPAAQVSAHYVVDRNGDIYQLVADTETAWHSGNKLVNQQSIGIEVVAWNTATGMTGTQEASLVTLAKFVLDSYDVPLANVVPHRSIKPTDCPGWVWPDDNVLATWKQTKLGSTVT
jgi:N-acetyl-anhydromuramyl-L-alanine amidase AmpD